ncbi:astacin-like metalloprotease toxin 5 [Leptidea sinapis]|uniref:astacin-like metalloprotease toxin 5 n=1 Tax=Leptidea sinapis TaxID=189913 RepID=UPI00213D3085|nr:astacin-like metalloprotease toxin 5 [Leptidea sinapis]
MIRATVLLCVLGFVVASPPLVKSREEIQAFRSYLESTKSSGNVAKFLVRNNVSPRANIEENSGKFQGDIVLDDTLIEEMVLNYATGRNAYIWPDTKWPENTVVYQFGEGEFGPLQQAAILEGIEAIENNTCVKFRYRNPEDTVFVNLTGSPDGCYAHVGYWEPRGVHTMNLARNYPGVGCFRHPTIVHEFMHILGFLHMHATYNRDEYVQIVEENIISGTEHNFYIYDQELVSNLGIEYDYISCLHYSAYAFSANGEKTIVALKEHEGVMGQREFVTDKDWLRINRHYNCPGAWD